MVSDTIKNICSDLEFCAAFWGGLPSSSHTVEKGDYYESVSYYLGNTFYFVDVRIIDEDGGPTLEITLSHSCFSSRGIIFEKPEQVAMGSVNPDIYLGCALQKVAHDDGWLRGSEFGLVICDD